jgi:hypothetical protein
MRTPVQYSRRGATVCLAVVLLVVGIASLAAAPGLMPFDVVRAQPASALGIHALPGVSGTEPAAITRFVALACVASVLAAGLVARSLRVAGENGAVSALARVSSPLRI